MSPNKDWIASFRSRTGMSQSDLAAMLCTSRTNIAMTENGQRLLPVSPMLQLVQLMQLMNDPQVIAAVPVINSAPEQAEKLRDELWHHAARKRFEAAALLQKIQTYELQQVQRQQARVLFEAMARHHQQYAPIERQARWLALRTGSFADNSFNMQGATAYQMDRLRYTMLLKEAEEAERMAEGEGDES